MAGEIYLTIIGNLTADPEMRQTQSGGRVVNLTIASTPRQFNRNSGQWEDGSSLFIRCSAWDTQHESMASNIQASLSKGMRVIARGRLEQRTWVDKQGNNRTSVEMRLDEIGPAMSRNTAQVTKVQQSNGFGNQQQRGVQQPQQPISNGYSAPAPGAQPQDPWGTAQEQEFGGNDGSLEF